MSKKESKFKQHQTLSNKLLTTINSKRTIAANICISALGAIGVASITQLSNYSTASYNSFLILTLTLILYFLRATFKPVSKRVRVASIIFSVFLSSILVLGRQLELLSEIIWTPRTLFIIFCLTFFIITLARPLIARLSIIKIPQNLVISRKTQIITFLIIFGVNLIWYFAIFPGIYGWDSALQAHRAIIGTTDTHYSVALSLAMGYGFKIGASIFGSFYHSLSVMMLLQSLFMSFIYTYIATFIGKHFKNRTLYYIAVLFFILNPFMSAMTIYSTQDTLFAGIFALFFIQLFKVSTIPDYWEKKKNIAIFAILAILLCLFRNNGIYILLFSGIFYLFISKNYKTGLFAFGIPLALTIIITKPFYSLCGIPDRTSIRETLSVPSQQLARVYTAENKSIISDEEREKIEYYYSDLSYFNRYVEQPMKADQAKAALDQERVLDNKLDYLKLWLQVGLKNPRKYIEAFLLNSLGTWYPNKNFNDDRANIPYIEYGMNTLWDEVEGLEYLRIDRNSKIPALEPVASGILYHNAWKYIPFLSTFCSAGFYFVLFLFLLVIYIVRKEKNRFIAFSTLIGLYMTLLLAPVTVFRYVYPVAIVLPIIFATLFQIDQTKKSNSLKKKANKKSP